MNLRMIALAGMLMAAAGTADAQNRVNANRSADLLNAQVLEVLRGSNPAPAPTPATAPTPVTVSATNPLTGVYVGAGLGTNWRDSSDYQWSLSMGYQINPMWAVELVYDQNHQNNRNTRNNHGQMVMTNVVMSPWRVGAVTPYALAGVGMGWNALGERGTGDNAGVYNVGAGARMAVTGNVSVDARYRYVDALNRGDVQNQHMITAGVHIRF